MTEKNEDILKSLMKETERLKAPAGFTNRVMQRIQAEEAAESWDMSWIFSPKYWIMIGLGLGIAVAFLFSYDLPFNIFSILEPQNLGSFSGSFIQSYQSLLHNLQMSNNALIIIGSVVGLFLLDRILRKRFTMGFFSF